MSRYLMLWKEENQVEYNKLLTQARNDRRCQACYKPLKKVTTPYCQVCYKNSIRRGNQEKKIKLKEIGLYTINYQQHLHRKFFGCNADIKYRGSVENRVYNNLKPETVMRQSTIFHRKLLSLEPSISEMYERITSQYNNIPTRLLYNATLYFIANHKLNYPFISDSVFRANIVDETLKHIERAYIATQEKQLSMNRLTLSPSTRKQVWSYISQCVIPIYAEL